MSEIPEKRVQEGGIQPAESRDSGLDTRVTKESINERSRLLGGTPEEILEAEEQGRALDLAEVKKVYSSTIYLS